MTGLMIKFLGRAKRHTYTALAKSINVLNHEPNVDETGFASDATKELISVAFAVKRVPVILIRKVFQALFYRINWMSVFTNMH